jgi:hypothetical protein
MDLESLLERQRHLGQTLEREGEQTRLSACDQDKYREKKWRILNDCGTANVCRRPKGDIAIAENTSAS